MKMLMRISDRLLGDIFLVVSMKDFTNVCFEILSSKRILYPHETQCVGIDFFLSEVLLRFLICWSGHNFTKAHGITLCPQNVSCVLEPVKSISKNHMNESNDLH